MVIKKLSVNSTRPDNKGKERSPFGAPLGRYYRLVVLEGCDACDLLAGINHNCLHAAFFNGVFAVFGTDDGCALRNQFSVEENFAAFDEGSYRHLSSVVVNSDICVCADGEVTLVCQTEHTGRV